MRLLPSLKLLRPHLYFAHTPLTGIIQGMHTWEAIRRAGRGEQDLFLSTVFPTTETFGVEGFVPSAAFWAAGFSVPHSNSRFAHGQTAILIQ